MEKEMFKIPMQYFAEDDKDDDKADGDGGTNNGSNDSSNDGNNNDGNKNSAGSKEGEKKEKTFSQEQVNRMMAKEKNQGRNAVYNELGINPKDAKQIESVKAYLESQKTDAQKEAEKQIAADTAVKEAEERAKLAEAKAEAMMLGIKPQFVEDAVTLALSKSDDRDIKSVLSEFKTKYPVWFNEEEDAKPKGTGSSLKGTQAGKGNDDKNKPQGIGARLAAQRKGTKSKTSYWSK